MKATLGSGAGLRIRLTSCSERVTGAAAAAREMSMQANKPLQPPTLTLTGNYPISDRIVSIYLRINFISPQSGGQWCAVALRRVHYCSQCLYSNAPLGNLCLLLAAAATVHCLGGTLSLSLSPFLVIGVSGRTREQLQLQLLA